MQTSPPTTAPATPHPSKLAAPRAGRRGCEQPRCARGNPKAAAAGGNEDDEGGPPREVRSEGSGPQSWARAAAPRPSDSNQTPHEAQHAIQRQRTRSVRPQKPTSQPPAQPLHQAQDSPSPPNSSNQAHGRPSLLPAQLHRHPLLQQHAAIRFDHIQIVDRPSRYCVCDSFAARAADATAASCARVWSARIRRFARLSSTSRNAFSTVCRYSATSSS